VPCIAERDRDWFLDPFDRVRSGGSAIVHLPSARHSFVERLFVELEQTNDARAASSLLTLIVSEIRDASTTQPIAAQGVVAESISFIERHCLGPLTLQHVASAIGRSPAYVTTAVKRATGKTVVEWIIDGRMSEARRLLRHSDEKIDAIAERVGYADPTHFIRMFRRAHGVTPAQWRSARR
jgi:AraC-like DNA-binding protein